MGCEKLRHPATLQEKVFFVRAESSQMEKSVKCSLLCYGDEMSGNTGMSGHQ